MPKRESKAKSHEPWYRIVTRSAVEIRRRCGVPDAQTEARMVRAFRAALRPRGKPVGDPTT